jgi:GNAT superfamily N-acetyltransferase
MKKPACALQLKRAFLSESKSLQRNPPVSAAVSREQRIRPVQAHVTVADGNSIGVSLSYPTSAARHKMVCSLHSFETMRSSHVPMTLEEFERLPQKPGWKFEYFDGVAHITPSHQIAVVTMEVTPRSAEHSCLLRAVTPEDQSALIPLFVDCFGSTIEYCDWDPDAILDSAAEAIRSFFAGRRGMPLPASRAAVCANELAGAALVVDGGGSRAILDMLFVSSRWQRQGLAAALVAASMNHLHGAGIQTLSSAYMSGNEPSQAWHRAFGFVEEPDILMARTSLRQARHELERRKRLGALTEPEQIHLEQECDRLSQLVDRLEAIAQEKGMEAVLPLLRYMRRG